jgi:protein TonB
VTAQSFHLPAARGEAPLSLLLGGIFALAVFAMIAAAQMLGDVRRTASALDEQIIAYEPPKVEVVEEEPPPPEEEPEPELEEEPPELSLDQLDIALNPGTGGSLAGDLAMIHISSSQKGLGTEAFLDFAALDQVPRPIGAPQFHFPSRLLKNPASGKIVLLLKLSREGRVMDAQVDYSNLPQFEEVVVAQVKRWKFTPPTQNGKPVQAQARFPIPIRIR